jgi:hypothetical protein
VFYGVQTPNVAELPELLAKTQVGKPKSNLGRCTIFKMPACDPIGCDYWIGNTRGHCPYDDVVNIAHLLRGRLAAKVIQNREPSTTWIAAGASTLRIM